MEEKSKMNQINNLAFDIMHETNQAEPFDRAAEIYQLSLRPKLNENQQIVFQHIVDECLENDLTYALWQFTDDVYEEPAMSVELSAHVRAWKELSDKERLQVLGAVMEKGLKEVAE
ncbi:MAG: hypothetical protein ACLRPU_00035 [Enterococcus hulanensis]